MNEKRGFYQKHYARTPREASCLEHRLKKVLDIFAKHKANIDKLLDVGCGDGSFTLLLKEASIAKDVHGIEISKEAVESANAKGINAIRIDVDEQDFPFENGYFDATFCGETIGHLFDPDHLLDELYRTLKPDGICVITTTNLAAWYDRLSLLLGFQPHWAGVSLRYAHVGKLKKMNSGDHIRHFTYRALRQLVVIHRFVILQALGTGETDAFPFPFKPIAVMARTIPSLSAEMIFVLRK